MTYTRFHEPDGIELAVRIFLQQYFPEIDKCRRSIHNSDRVEFIYEFGIGGEKLERIQKLVGKYGNRFGITAENNYLVIGFQLNSKGKI